MALVTLKCLLNTNRHRDVNVSPRRSGDTTPCPVDSFALTLLLHLWVSPLLMLQPLTQLLTS